VRHYVFAAVRRKCNEYVISSLWHLVYPDNILKQSNSVSVVQFADCSHLSLPQYDDPCLSSVFTFLSSSSSSSSSSSPPPPPLNLISYPSHYVSPPPPIRLLNRTHWPWLICCIWLNERSFTYLITMATGINDKWPLGRNTEVLGKKTTDLLSLY